MLHSKDIAAHIVKVQVRIGGQLLYLLQHERISHLPNDGMQLCLFYSAPELSAREGIYL